MVKEDLKLNGRMVILRQVIVDILSKRYEKSRCWI